MRRGWTACLALLAMAAGAVFASGDAAAPRAMALTFDDLPYVDLRSGDAGGLERARAATTALVRALAAHHAPSVGFVNEGKLAPAGETAARTALLQQWIDAGAILGNHTYSHADFDDLTVEQFEEEIVKGEVVTRRLMEPRRPYPLWFRPPKTHTGETAAKKEAVGSFLAARGYRIAPHTVESSDYLFNAAYDRALAGGDAATAARLRAAYLDFTLRALEFAERVAPAVFGRDIPQTILLHANDLNADALDDLLKMLEARGYRFVPLDVAASDPAYATKDTLVTPFGPTWLWRWSRSLGQTLSFKDDPEPPAWIAAPTPGTP